MDQHDSAPPDLKIWGCSGLSCETMGGYTHLILVRSKRFETQVATWENATLGIRFN